MNIFELLKKFITPTISDEEVAEHDWVLCPKCNVNITKEDLQDNDWVCPNCKTKILQE